METCPVCLARIEYHYALNREMYAVDPGVLYEECDRADAVPMLSFSGHLTRGVPVHTCTGGHIGFRLHDCSEPHAPAGFTTYFPDEEDDLPW